MWLWSWLCWASAADPEWQRVETPHFVVVSEGPAGSARDLARHLEEFHVLLAQLTPSLQGRTAKVPVLVFKSRTSLVDWLPVRKGGAYADIGAWLVEDPDRPLIAVDGLSWQASTDMVFGGYYRAAVAQPSQPRWLTHGFAEFFATTWIDGHLAHVGTPAPDTLATLGTRWFPYDEVFAADARSPIFHDARARRMFDAQAWLFVHWCWMDPARTKKLVDFLGRLDDGPVEALQASFGLTVAQLTEELQSWTRTNRWLETRYTLAEAIEVDRAEATAAPPAEAAYLLGRLLLSSGRVDEAAARFEQARAADPASWLGYDGLGLVAELQTDRTKAMFGFKEAIARSPPTPAPHLSYASAALASLTPAELPVVVDALRQALTLDPSRVDAWGLLAAASLKGNDPGAAKIAAGRGLQLDPHDARLRLVLGSVQLAAGDLDKARLNAALAVKHCHDEALCAEASSLAAAASPTP